MGVNGDLARVLWETGALLIEDDKHDLAYLSYWGRKNHRYHGEVRPNHPSPFHHYQLGSLFCLISQMMGAMDMLQEISAASQEYASIPQQAPGLIPNPKS